MKKSWKIFWDLQCPYSRRNWQKLAELRTKFAADYEFTVYITSLAFHPQAFTAQCGAALIENKKGRDAMFQYVDACFEKQESFMNATIGDARKSEIDAVFASIAESAGVFDDANFRKEDFLSGLHDWETAVKPAYAEHKIALRYGVYGTPKHVVDEELLEDTESDWGVKEWDEKLKALAC